MVNILNLLEQFIFPLEVILGTGPFCKMKSSPATLINILGISTDDGPSHHQMMFFFLFQRHLGVSTNASTLQWMVDSMVKPMKVDDLGETPILDTLGHLQLTKS